MARTNKSIAFRTANVFTFRLTNNGSNQFFANAGEKLCAIYRVVSRRLQNEARAIPFCESNGTALGVQSKFRA